MIKKTLYFGNPAYLSLRNKQLVIKLPEVERATGISEVIRKEATRTIPIEDIGIVVLDNREITITQGLLAALMHNTAAVVTCDSRRMPAGLLMPLEGNSIHSERFRSQLEASLPLKKQLWQQTVKAKIENQAMLLSRHIPLKDCGCMNNWAKNVKSGDSDNLEARAAVYYWKNIFSEIPGFIRDREGSPPNNLLNYGYAILRATIARALVSSGLLPVAGIHHRNRYNAYCLADDIMEPYRPFVDATVIEIMKDMPRPIPEELTTELKAKLLTIPTLDVVIDGKRSPLMIAASQTTASLAKCYSGEIRKISYPVLP